MWQHLRLPKESGKGSGRECRALAQHCCELAAEGRNSGAQWLPGRAHPSRGFLASLPLPALSKHLPSKASPWFSFHCLLMSKCNAWSDRVETTLNQEPRDWEVRKISCPVLHSSACFQTCTRVHTAQGNKSHTFVLPLNPSKADSNRGSKLSADT